jgi:hypothetical protein
MTSIYEWNMMAEDGTARVPGKECGKVTVEWLNSFFGNTIIIASLGAGFSFSTILSVPTPPTRTTWPLGYTGVQPFLAASWALLVFAIGIAVAASHAFKCNEARLIEKLDCENRPALVIIGLVSFVLQLLIITAFLLVERVITAYVPSFGLIAFGITGLFGLVAVGLCCVYCKYHSGPGEAEHSTDSVFLTSL